MKTSKIILTGCFLASLCTNMAIYAYNDLTVQLDVRSDIKQQGSIQLDIDNYYNSGSGENHDHMFVPINYNIQTPIIVARPSVSGGMTLQYTILGVRIQGAQIPIICSPYAVASKFSTTYDTVTIHATVTPEGIPSCTIDNYK